MELTYEPSAGTMWNGAWTHVHTPLKIHPLTFIETWHDLKHAHSKHTHQDQKDCLKVVVSMMPDAN